MIAAPGSDGEQSNTLNEPVVVLHYQPAAGVLFGRSAMTTEQGNALDKVWPALGAIASLGRVPPEGERDLKARLSMQLGAGGTADWEPTPLGESLALSIVTMAVRTAMPQHQTPVYAALEDGALDRIMDTLQRSIVRVVKEVSAA